MDFIRKHLWEFDTEKLLHPPLHFHLIFIFFLFSLSSEYSHNSPIVCVCVGGGAIVSPDSVKNIVWSG